MTRIVPHAACVAVAVVAGTFVATGVASAQEGDDQDCGESYVCVDVDPQVGPVIGPNEFGPFEFGPFEFESIF